MLHSGRSRPADPRHSADGSVQVFPIIFVPLALDSGWTLSARAFDRLLAILDDDRDAAADAYGQLRHRIAGLHRWWGAPDPDALADATLDRTARKLPEGASVERADSGACVRGVARMVFYEASRQKAPVVLERDPVAATMDGHLAHGPPNQDPPAPNETGGVRHLMCQHTVKRFPGLSHSLQETR